MYVLVTQITVLTMKFLSSNKSSGSKSKNPINKYRRILATNILISMCIYLMNPTSKLFLYGLLFFVFVQVIHYFYNITRGEFFLLNVLNYIKAGNSGNNLKINKNFDEEGTDQFCDDSVPAIVTAFYDSIQYQNTTVSTEIEYNQTCSLSEDCRKKSKLPDCHTAILQKLLYELEVEKVYLDTDLTIELLAKKLGTNRSYLSVIIMNHYHKNFRQLINEYRIKQALELIAGDAVKNLTIEGLGHEVGFKHSSSFRMAFHKHTGRPPSFFVKYIVVGS